MALVVTHGFSSAIADDPVASAAGEVLPSHWNANHTLTGVVTPDQGGTGVANNAASTWTISGNFATTVTVTGITTLTLPTSGTVATTSNKLSAFAATTSAELAGVISDETGTGALVLADSPALAGTPTAPTATAGTNTTQLATTAFVLANGGGSIAPLVIASASIVEQRSTATAQAFKVYNTYTDASNYERFTIDWKTTANTLTVGTEAAGTGTGRSIEFLIGSTSGGTLTFLGNNKLILRSDAGTFSFYEGSGQGKGQITQTAGYIASDDRGFCWWNGNLGGTIDTALHRVAAAVVEVDTGTPAGGAYLRLNGVAVGSLPVASATYRGCHGTVTNSTAALTAGIGAVVASATSTASGDVVPVFCDGINWRIG